MSLIRHKTILVINGGSSSIKFALFSCNNSLSRLLSGKIDRIGLPNGTAQIKNEINGKTILKKRTTPSHAAAVPAILYLLRDQTDTRLIHFIGHRIVHGGKFRRAARLTKAVLTELSRLSRYVPEHLPAEIALIREFSRRLPGRPQVACFDTSFHRTMPEVAKLLPIPRKFRKFGLERYGFHGLSYSYLSRKLKELEPRADKRKRVIIAHLGNGASLAAVKEGKSMDTTMAFTPAAGIPMSTRSGDLDPGLVSYFARTFKYSIDQFHDMVNSRSGLLGVSGISPDMRDLLHREQREPGARDAVNLFCYHAAKAIGALTVALGGLTTLIFSGGIGENAAPVRRRICERLSFLGVTLDPRRNRSNAPIISKPSSSVRVRIIPTDEETEIARSVFQLLISRPKMEAL